MQRPDPQDTLATLSRIEDACKGLIGTMGRLDVVLKAVQEALVQVDPSMVLPDAFGRSLTRTARMSLDSQRRLAPDWIPDDWGTAQKSDDPQLKTWASDENGQAANGGAEIEAWLSTLFRTDGSGLDALADPSAAASPLPSSMRDEVLETVQTECRRALTKVVDDLDQQYRDASEELKHKLERLATNTVVAFLLSIAISAAVVVTVAHR